MNQLADLGAVLGSRTSDARLDYGAWSLHAGEPVKLLLVEDDEDDAILFKKLVSKIPDANFDVRWVSGPASGLQALATERYDAAIVDYRLGASTGVEFLRDAAAAGSAVPLIMLTGQRDRTIDMVAMKAGAADFLVKGQTDTALLDRTLRYVISSARVRDELNRSRRQILGVEEIGRMLSEEAWPGAEAIQELLRVLAEDFGYRYVAVYLQSGEMLELAGSSGYQQPTPTLDPTNAAMARQIKHQQHAILSSLTRSPDDRDVDADVRLELSLPLVVDGNTAGLLNVGSPDAEQLGQNDVAVLTAVASRLSAALATSQERGRAAARSQRLNRLVAFTAEVGSAATGTSDGEYFAWLVRAAATATQGAAVLFGTEGGSLLTQAVESGPVMAGAGAEGIRQIANSALVGGPASTGTGQTGLAAIVIAGWSSPVVLVSVGSADAFVMELLRQIAVVVTPILDLRMKAGLAEAQENGRSTFCAAADWAIARDAHAGMAGAHGILLVESVDGQPDLQELLALVRGRVQTQMLTVPFGGASVAVLVAAPDAEAVTRWANELVRVLAETRDVLGGISLIGDENAEAATARALGAVVLARRLGRGNTIAA